MPTYKNTPQNRKLNRVGKLYSRSRTKRAATKVVVQRRAERSVVVFILFVDNIYRGQIRKTQIGVYSSRQGAMRAWKSFKINEDELKATGAIVEIPMNKGAFFAAGKFNIIE